MNPQSVHVLLIEDNAADARLMLESLRESAALVEVRVTQVARVGEIREALRRAGAPADVALVDLSLPDSQGLATVERVRATAPGVPVVVVTGLHDHALAVEALRRGVQDYLVKGELDRGAAARAVRYAIERQRGEAMRVSKEAAEAANRAKDAFLAMVSHDLRGPLSAVILWAKLIQNGKVKAADLPMIGGMIVRCAQEQARLIDDLLTMNEANEGRLRVDRRPTDLAELARSTAEAARTVAEADGVSLEAEGLDRAVSVMGDGARLRQVISNLLFNAIKFTPSGGRVRLTLDEGGEGGAARLRVADTGRGIDPALLGRVFERYWQADQPPDAKYRGMGLGLSIARSIVDLHGGRIAAASDGVGRGATFTVELPLAHQNDHHLQQVPVPTTAGRAGAPGAWATSGQVCERE